MRSLPAIVLVCCLLMLAACKSRPSYVIDPDRMSEVLADMHTAEAVIDVHRHDYQPDSNKQALKNAIFARHGITEADFDTSLVWYGHNIDKYLDIYDKTIALLEKRSARLGTMMLDAAMSMAGDSVDVWVASRYLKLSKRLPSNMVAFDIKADENTEKGDIYTWRMKVLDSDNNTTINWSLFANYDDNTTEYMNAVTSQQGWNEMSFLADSTKQLTRLRGYFQPTDDSKADLWIDSISLIRKRVNPDRYQQRYRQRAHHEY